MNKINIDSLREAVKKHNKLSDWLKSQSDNILVSDEIRHGMRVISGLAKEFWSARVWAAKAAGEYISAKLTGGETQLLAGTICWLAAHGSERHWAKLGTGDRRCIPTEYLDAVFTFLCAALDAACAPRPPTRPLYHRTSRGGGTWDAVFLCASKGTDIVAGLKELSSHKHYGSYAQLGQHILLAQNARRVIAGNIPLLWDVEEYKPGAWRVVTRHNGPYKSREEANKIAEQYAQQSMENVKEAHLAAHKALGLTPIWKAT